MHSPVSLINDGHPPLDLRQFVKVRDDTLKSGDQHVELEQASYAVALWGGGGEECLTRSMKNRILGDLLVSCIG